MSSATNMEEYYQRVIQLQERLRQSEEERLKLEMKFNGMLQVMKEEEEAHFKKLRTKYKQFLEEDRRRQYRNDKILEALDRIENRTAMWEAKTEKFKVYRKKYRGYVKQACKEQRNRSPLDDERTYPDVKYDDYKPMAEKQYDFQKRGKREDSDGSENGVMEKYLQNLSSSKCKEDILQRKSNLPPETKYSNLGNINSIYTRPITTEKGDAEKNEKFDNDFTQLKNTKDLENALKQNYNRSDDDDKFGFNRDEFFESSKEYRKNPDDEYDKDNYATLEKQSSGYYNTTAPPTNSDYSSSFSLSQNNQKPLVNNRKSIEGHTKSDEFRNEPIDSPRQVHNDLERMLKEHRNSTSSQLNESLKSPTPAYSFSNSQPQPSQPIPKPTAHPVPRETSPITTLFNKDDFTTPKAINSQPSQPQESAGQNMNISETAQQRQPLIQQQMPTPKAINSQPSQPQESARQNMNISETAQQRQPIIQQQQMPIENNTEKSEPPQRRPSEINPNNQQKDVSKPPAPNIQDEKINNEASNDNRSPVQAQESISEEIPPERFNQEKSEQQHQEETDQYHNQQYYDENSQPLPQYDDNSQPLPQYDENGQLLPQFDENGQPVQHYVQDGQAYEQNSQQMQQYDENSQPIAQYDENGQPIAQYDENGQPIAQYDENGQPIAQYDENGQPIQPYYSEGEHIQSQYYDENGQPMQQYYDNTGHMQGYDDNGQSIVQYDENGQPLVQYDETGQPIPQYNENGEQLQQQYYDENGQPLQYYQENPQQMYDENGQPLQEGYNSEAYQQQYYEQEGASEQQQQDETNENVQEQPIQEGEQTKSNVLDMLETDTESVKQDTKISNDSDFDLSNA